MLHYIAATTNKKIFKYFIFITSVVMIFYFNNLISIKTLIKTQSNQLKTYRFDSIHRDYNIYALVFYGRKQNIQILLPYLEANVKANGGVLDKIVFAIKTNNKDDLAYLDSILALNKSYIERKHFAANKKYFDIYKPLKDNDLIFKIDDDIAFISENTFENMLDEYLTNNSLFLSANVVNHPLLSYVHARLGAIQPFIEINNYTWVLSNNRSELDRLIEGYTYNAFSKWWSNPKPAAIAHESLLYHIQTNNIRVYDFNRWDFHSAGYTRWSINFFLGRGEYMNKMRQLLPKMEDDDEVAISQELPKIYQKHCYALGSAVVAHFSYFTQRDYLYKTNILEKYRNLSKLINSDYF